MRSCVEQRKLTSETVCSVFHVPAYMVGVGPAPTYNNIEALNHAVLLAVPPDADRGDRAAAG